MVNKKLRFLISLPTSKNDFQLAQAFSAEKTAQKRGIDLEIVYADNDALQQSTQILKAIQVPVGTRPDAIVIEPASGTALPHVARAACAVGIGWAVLNRAPDYISELRRTSTAPIFSVSSDHVEIGRIQGRQFAALLPDGGSVLYIEGPSHSMLAATICIPPIAGQAVESLIEAIQNGTKPPEYSATVSFSIPPLDALSARKS